MNSLLTATLIATGLIFLVFIYTYSGLIYNKWKLHSLKKTVINVPKAKLKKIGMPVQVHIINW
jgi:hypothetical protein